ncbi:MAG: hypothetical protein KC548_04700 [Nanoarchaeota archaeon]|nr:hypothetical protein [Nanoarchaeota archaeon]
MKKKKIVLGLTMTGLIFSAPLAAFAFNHNGADTYKHGFGHSDLIDNPDYEKQIERLEETIQRKIDQANKILEEVEIDEETEKELKEIIAEYSELETYLETSDLSSAQVEDLKDLYFQYKEETSTLTTEFRTVLRNTLTDEELAALKEKLLSSDRFGNQASPPKFTAETLKIIDEDLAQSYANGDLTDAQVAEQVKEIMDSFSDDERKEIFDELKESNALPQQKHFYHRKEERSLEE